MTDYGSTIYHCSTMEMGLQRIGKIAMLAAMSDEKEEERIKKEVSENMNEYRLAVTFISGLSTDISKSFVKSIVGCALQNNVIRKSGTQIHAVLHAALDSLKGVIHQVPAEASLKLKVGIVSNQDWVAVAIYGDSAFYPITNHERSALSMMHLR